MTESDRSIAESLRRCFGFIEPDRRFHWVVLVVLAFTVSLLEAISALMVFLLLTMVTGGVEEVTIPLVGSLVERFPNVPEGTLFLAAAGVIAFIFVLRAAMFLLQTYLQYRVAHNTGVRLSVRLFEGYVRMPYAFHLRRNSAQLIRTAYTSVLEVVSQVFTPLVAMASELLLVVAIVAVLMMTAPIPTVVSVVVLGPVVWLVLRVVQPRLVTLGTRYQESAGGSLQALQESLEGIREVKLLGAVEYFGHQFGRSRAALSHSSYMRMVLTEIPRISIETILFLFIIGFLGVTVVTTGSPQDAFPVLGLFAYAVVRVLPAFNRVVANANSLRFGSAAIDYIWDDLDQIQRLPRDDQHATTRTPFNDVIVLEGVSFQYEGANHEALKEINLSIARGESVGVVGPTGGGKSTLIDVVLGLLEPTQGRVLVDGRDIQVDVEGWQQQLGVVPQQVFLFDDTLRNNIALGLCEEEIDPNAVEEAVHLAQLGEVVHELPNGLDSLLGERGVRLSGGQRQRVAIARALYRRPAVLVFDEGTSALDTATETALIEALSGLQGRRTLITIAHRLSTVRGCDRIIVVDQGRVRAKGSYDELLENSPEFRRLTQQA